MSVSLDAIDNDVFRRMTDTDYTVEQVMAGIAAAKEAGLGPVKVNCVVVRDANDGQVESMVERFRGTGVAVRFIEFMDVGTTNGWKLDQVVPAAEIVTRLHERWPIEPLEPGYLGEVAGRYRYQDGAGEVGVIASVTRPFCGDCTRLRLSADGKLYTCLFAATGTDIRGRLRDGTGDDDLAALIDEVWTNRDDRYSELRSRSTGDLDRVEMSYIGG